MTITVTVTPAVQAALASQAAAHGRDVESHAATLLEAAAHLPDNTLTDTGKQRQAGSSSLLEVFAMVRGLTDDVHFSRDTSTDRAVEL